MIEIVPWVSLAVSVFVGIVGSLVSYTIRHRDVELERRLALLEALVSRVAAAELRAAVLERDTLHVQADITVIKRDLAELLRIARVRPSVADE